LTIHGAFGDAMLADVLRAIDGHMLGKGVPVARFHRGAYTSRVFAIATQ